MTDKQPQVHAAIIAVAKAMSSEGIGKGRKNKEQGYSFRGIDDVLNSLAGHYVANNIFVIPSYRSRVLHEYQSTAGKRVANVCVEGTFTITSAVDGSTVVVGPIFGEAMDSADKASNKAASAAYKYFAIQTFAIPTEGENDADARTHEVVPNDVDKQEPGEPASAGAAARARVAKLGESPVKEVKATPPSDTLKDEAQQMIVDAQKCPSINELRKLKDSWLPKLRGTGLWPQVAATIMARVTELEQIAKDEEEQERAAIKAEAKGSIPK